jgi:hypothetical protein
MCSPVLVVAFVDVEFDAEKLKGQFLILVFLGDDFAVDLAVERVDSGRGIEGNSVGYGLPVRQNVSFSLHQSLSSSSSRFTAQPVLQK